MTIVLQANLNWTPMVSTEDCAKTVLDGIRHGNEYLTEPRWMGVLLMWKTMSQNTKMDYPFTHHMFVGKQETIFITKRSYRMMSC